jgi:hypothetical protein
MGKKLLLKFEGAGAAFEKKWLTVANTWEELTFDYTGVANVCLNNQFSFLIFDLGTLEMEVLILLFDEITQPELHHQW